MEDETTAWDDGVISALPVRRVLRRPSEDGDRLAGGGQLAGGGRLAGDDRLAGSGSAGGSRAPGVPASGEPASDNPASGHPVPGTQALATPPPVTTPPPTTPPPWHHAVPAVAQLLADGWTLGAATVLVGENGAGKPTLVEGLADACGLGVEGGSRGSRHGTRATESTLADELVVWRGVGAPHRAFFLRAETMHSFYTYLEDNPGARPEPRFHEMSHGESFLALVADRMRFPGLYLLDEPESALSFTGCLALLAHLGRLLRDGAQVVLSTHSPVLAALPGATIWELGGWGMRRRAWDDLDLVRSWRRFLDDPGAALRALDDE